MPSLADDTERSEHCAAMLKALAHPLRLRIVAILASREEHVNAMAEHLGVRQSVVSQHLRILRMSDLVSARREDGLAIYRLTLDSLVQLVSCIERCAAG